VCLATTAKTLTLLWAVFTGAAGGAGTTAAAPAPRHHRRHSDRCAAGARATQLPRTRTHLCTCAPTASRRDESTHVPGLLITWVLRSDLCLRYPLAASRGVLSQSLRKQKSRTPLVSTPLSDPPPCSSQEELYFLDEAAAGAMHAEVSPRNEASALWQLLESVLGLAGGGGGDEDRSSDTCGSAALVRWVRARCDALGERGGGGEGEFATGVEDDAAGRAMVDWARAAGVVGPVECAAFSNGLRGATVTQPVRVNPTQVVC
jgi:hypothetical protein